MEALDPGVIIAIDDNHFDLRLITEILTQAGHTVHGFLSASQAIRQIENLQPEIVLIDLNMEEMNGYDACRQIREQPALAELPVIFITVLDETVSLIEGFRAGAVDYITKPFRQPELLARIHTHLTTSRLKRKLNRQNEQLALEIQDRSQLMDLISQAKKEWEEVFDSVTDMIFLTDERNCVMRCNRAAAERFESIGDHGGGAWRQVLYRPIGELFFGDKEASQRMSQVKEAQFPQLPGWFDISMYPVYEKYDRLMTVYIIKDITARKQMEEALAASQKFASLGTLVAGIAHEINSPLQVLTGLTQSLSAQCEQGQIEPERLRRSLDMLYRNSWRVAEIVRALRLYAHDSNGQFDKHALDKIVQDTLLLIEHQLKSWSNITVHTRLAPNLPDLECDRDEISQALINLLNNARDAMPAGGEITIRTDYAGLHDQLLLEVSDSGSGIPEEIQNKIFDPFFTTKALGQGTGLGLSIVTGIMRSHHGEIRIQSKPNQGSVFSLIFPCNQPVVVDQPSSFQVNLHGRFGDSIPATFNSQIMGK